MTRRRDTSFDLDQALADPGFTPRAADVPALLDRLAGDEATAERAQRALLRAGIAAGTAAAARVESATGTPRARLVTLAGRVAAQSLAAGDTPEGAALLAAVLAWLGDDDERTRRLAAAALGKIARPEVEAALVAALAREEAEPVRRAITASLGKIGGEAALAAVSGAEAQGALGERTRARARLMVERTALRAETSRVRLDVAAPRPLRVVLRCRTGLEPILAGELDRELSPRIPRDAFGPGRVEATLASRAPSSLLAARTMLDFAFALPVARVREDATDAERADAVVDALASDEAFALLRAFTEGPIRYRLAWAGGGKRRATVWHVAEAVRARRPELVNDPTESPWEALVREAPGAVAVELAPRVDDPRFAYRKGDVPAASHPTLAAALVRVAGVSDDDVVWDPFVGSGTELCERALAGPYRRLVGSDMEDAALRIAHENLKAAGARAELVRGDATRFAPEGVTLVLTNPPMGRRVLRGADLGAFLERFVAHAAEVLGGRGKLVWISPLPARTLRAAERAGLAPMMRREVDMGGFFAEIQVFAPHAHGATRRATAPAKGKAPARRRG